MLASILLINDQPVMCGDCGMRTENIESDKEMCLGCGKIIFIENSEDI